MQKSLPVFSLVLSLAAVGLSFWMLYSEPWSSGQGKAGGSKEGEILRQSINEFKQEVNDRLNKLEGRPMPKTTTTPVDDKTPTTTTTTSK